MPDMPASLLIVDDQPDTLALLLHYLEAQALDLRVALGGEDGLAKAVADPPDLVLLDVTMPGLDGFTVCRWLKEDPRTQDVPVIFLSAHDELEHKLQGFRLGAVDYITKPFRREEVLARVALQLQADHRWRLLTALEDRATPEAGATRSEGDRQLFVRAAAYLEGCLDAPPPLADLARRVGTNVRRLTAVFRRHAGMTVFDYHQAQRLETARRLLENSTLLIKQVTARVGYAQQGDFSRAFRRRFGVTPRDYRRARGVVTDAEGETAHHEG